MRANSTYISFDIESYDDEFFIFKNIVDNIIDKNSYNINDFIINKKNINPVTKLSRFVISTDWKGKDKDVFYSNEYTAWKNDILNIAIEIAKKYKQREIIITEAIFKSDNSIYNYHTYIIDSDFVQS